jgi:hypothetical protein
MLGANIASPLMRRASVGSHQVGSGSDDPALGTDWPDETNTGVQSGVTLTDVTGDVASTADDQVIENLNITDGTITVTHERVIVKNCRITSGNTYGVKGTDPNGSDVAGLTTPPMVLHCEINGPANSTSLCGTVAFCNLSNCENGYICPQALDGMPQLHIHDNYMHDFVAGGEPHYDGIEMNGGNSNILIEHNVIDNENDQTSAIQMNNLAGTLSNVTVKNNKLSGGDFTIYCDGHFGASLMTGITIQDNDLGTGSVGYFDFNATSPNTFGNFDSSRGNVYPSGQSQDVLPGTALFTPSSALTSNDTNQDISLRMVATLAAAAPGTVRVAMHADGSHAMQATHIAIGKWNGTDADTTATPLEAQFGGTSGFDLAAGEYILSDAIDVSALGLASGDKVVVIFDIPNVIGQGQSLGTGNTNCTSWFKSSDQSWNVAAPSGYTQSANNNFSLMGIITEDA